MEKLGQVPDILSKLLFKSNPRSGLPFLSLVISVSDIRDRLGLKLHHLGLGYLCSLQDSPAQDKCKIKKSVFLRFTLSALIKGDATCLFNGVTIDGYILEH